MPTGTWMTCGWLVSSLVSRRTKIGPKLDPRPGQSMAWPIHLITMETRMETTTDVTSQTTLATEQSRCLVLLSIPSRHSSVPNQRQAVPSKAWPLTFRNPSPLYDITTTCVSIIVRVIVTTLSLFKCVGKTLPSMDWPKCWFEFMQGMIHAWSSCKLVFCILFLEIIFSTSFYFEYLICTGHGFQQVTGLLTIYIEAIVFSAHWKYDLFNLKWTWQDVDSYFWSINISWWSKWNQHFHYLGSTLSLNLSKWLKSLLAWSMISFNLRKGVFEKVSQQRVSNFYFFMQILFCLCIDRQLVQRNSFKINRSLKTFFRDNNCTHTLSPQCLMISVETRSERYAE